MQLIQHFGAFAFVALSALPAAAETRILAFGDSNTWGWEPVAAGFPTERYPDDVRWSGVLESALGDEATVVVDGLVGRRTDIDAGDAIGLVGAPAFNGAKDLPAAVARNLPLDLVVVMLGTNDLQAGVERSPSDVAEAAVGLAALVSGSQGAVFSAYPAPKVLIVAPPAFGDTSSTPLGGLFGAGEDPSRALAEAFAAATEKAGVPFFDAGSVIATGGVDGIHLTAENHRALGEALAPVVANLIAE